jgi:hypothetical protein
VRRGADSGPDDEAEAARQLRRRRPG